MSELLFNRESFDTLLKIARAEKRALEVDLQDIEHARLAAQNAFANIEIGSDADDERRKCLCSSVFALQLAEDKARERVQLVGNEIAKLDHIFATVATAPGSYSREIMQCDIVAADQRIG